MSLKLAKKKRKEALEIIVSGTGLIENDFNELIEWVNDSIAEEQPNIILNLEAVKVLNSLGLNTLIKIFTKCRNNGGDMYIVNISEKINQVLLLTKLNTVLNIATSTEEAVELLN